MITVTIESTRFGEGKTTLANDIKHVMEQEGNRVFLEDEVTDEGLSGGRTAKLGFREEERRQNELSVADVHIIVKQTKTHESPRREMRRNYNAAEKQMIAEGRHGDAKNSWHQRQVQRV